MALTRCLAQQPLGYVRDGWQDGDVIWVRVGGMASQGILSILSRLRQRVMAVRSFGAIVVVVVVIAIWWSKEDRWLVADSDYSIGSDVTS